MPRGNKSGPDGMGPMTGRGAGICSGSGTPGYMNHAGGRGLGCGRSNGFVPGMGYGRGNGYGAGSGRGMRRGMGSEYAPPAALAPEVEKKHLEQQAGQMEEELKAIRKRLDDLDTKAAE